MEGVGFAFLDVSGKKQCRMPMLSRNEHALM